MKPSHIAIIYLLGSILTYMSVKYWRVNILQKAWTITERGLTFLYCLFSWLALILSLGVMLLIYIVTNTEDEKIENWFKNREKK